MMNCLTLTVEPVTTGDVLDFTIRGEGGSHGRGKNSNIGRLVILAGKVQVPMELSSPMAAKTHLCGAEYLHTTTLSKLFTSSGTGPSLYDAIATLVRGSITHPHCAEELQQCSRRGRSTRRVGEELLEILRHR
jgi:hypothetical protein